MANRRMFSSRIGNSAKFLQMPSESQLLYFHLVIRADDDGIVESYPIMKMLGLAPDNFKVLIAKNFIKQLNEDQVIVITDWLEHNLIRADRKIDSVYIKLLKEKAPEIKLIEPKPRSDVEDNSKRLGGLSTDGISQVKLSKDKIREEVADDTPSFSFKEELKKIMEGKRKDSKIIAFYFIKKGLVFHNRQQFNSAFTEELRNAKKLIGYSKEELEKIMDFCEADSKKNEYEWKLSTVVKKSSITINKI